MTRHTQRQVWRASKPRDARMARASMSCKRRGRTLSYCLWGAQDPQTPWYWASGLPNCARINLCCSRPPCLGYLVTAALETNTAFAPPLQGPHILICSCRSGQIITGALLLSQRCRHLDDELQLPRSPSIYLLPLSTEAKFLRRDAFSWEFASLSFYSRNEE